MNQSYYPSQNPLLKFSQEMKLRKFSPKTIQSYQYYITDLLKYSNKNPKTVNTEDIRGYLEYLTNKNFPASTLKLPITIYKISKVR